MQKKKPTYRAAAPGLPAARRSPTPPLLAELGPRGARRRCRSRSSVPWSPLPPPPLEELSPRGWPPPPPPLAEVSHGEPAAAPPRRVGPLMVGARRHAARPGSSSQEPDSKKKREKREGKGNGERELVGKGIENHVGSGPLHVRASVKKSTAGREGHGRLQIQHRAYSIPCSFCNSLESRSGCNLKGNLKGSERIGRDKSPTNQNTPQSLPIPFKSPD